MSCNRGELERDFSERGNILIMRLREIGYDGCMSVMIVINVIIVCFNLLNI